MLDNNTNYLVSKYKIPCTLISGQQIYSWGQLRTLRPESYLSRNFKKLFG